MKTEKKMKPYEKYKDTKITWIERIPEHWEVKKIKWLFLERVEKNAPHEQLLVSSKYHGVIPLSNFGERTTAATKDFENLKIVKEGDFVISLRSFQSGIEYAYFQGIISPAYTILKSKGEIDNRYFRQLGKSEPFINLLKNCVTGIREGQNINYSILRNNFLPIPPLPEQIQIAKYLDWKVSQINKIIKMINGKASIDPKNIINYPNSYLALLVEYRIKLISDVVTGQIDVQDAVVPDFDKVDEEIEEENDTER